MHGEGNDFPEIARLGDDAIIVRFGESISWETGSKIRAVADRIRDTHTESVTDVVPAYTTLAVYFDSARITFEAVSTVVRRELRDAVDSRAVDSSLIEIAVRYDGPDLPEVAERTGLAIAEVIERHSSRTYRAYMSGFVPGFAYLGELDASLVLPRRSAPRVRVPVGSVAIAGEQTAVYPFDTPGGWHLIGRTSARMFDPRRDQPALIRPGDSVRFVRSDR